MPSNPVQPEVERPPGPSSVPSILIADPDDDARARFRQAFALEGWDVREAADGRDALAKALACTPGFVLAEMALAFVDACALTVVLRRDPATAGVPILIITADARPAVIERARRAGADLILAKPARVEDLVTLIRPLLLGRSAAVSGAVLGRNQSAPESVKAVHAAPRRVARTKSFARFSTVTPPSPPPPLTCPSCDRLLAYQQSHIGGVSDRHQEQWDYYRCPGACGTFQYRQRTRSMRRVESAPSLRDRTADPAEREDDD